ncbi:MAG: double-strand break repair helicase AddA [Pseudomonadota bacterium]
MKRYQETIANQRNAADPARSAFVMANAGSGKTRVLINRVARLLLQRVNPEKILCITFTKAAAAEMADRLFGLLGDWALLDDKALHERLEDLEGEAVTQRSAQQLSRVRQLFARALETPGGLKIQTIHSFCESLIRRFPLEAGAIPGFAVLEDADAVSLAQQVIDALARSSALDRDVAEDLNTLSKLRSETELRKLLIEQALPGLKAHDLFQGADTPEDAVRRLAIALNVNPEISVEDRQKQFVTSLDVDTVDSARLALEAGGKKAKEDNAAPLQAFLNASTLQQKWDALSRLLLTQAGSPRKKFSDAKVEKTHPWVKPYLFELQADFLEVCEAVKAQELFKDTAAFYRISHNAHARYARIKAAHAALDFDDLILHARMLLQRTDKLWVRYKLDYGIDHVLVDETQDTSPAQWDVIEALIDDFLSGQGARDDPRTFFAVGDTKQSIYSFQGAASDLFEVKEADLGKKLAARHQSENRGDFSSIKMQMSFRTTKPILEFVDAAFHDPQIAEGMGKDGVPAHFEHRTGDAGRVEIWPLCPRPEKDETEAWDAPVDAPALNDPKRRLALRVADTIQEWLENAEPLASKGRSVRPGDIMILVQSRGVLFDETIRALARKGTPVAGADRLKLLEDPAIEDLLSYSKFCMQTKDDLSLAEILKSPFFNFNDDNDLFPLAYGREKGVSLWQALSKRAPEQTHWRDARDEIVEAQTIARRDGAFAFLMHVLDVATDPSGWSGRRRLYRRLGKASRESIDEMLRLALEFERGRPRSLQAFLLWFEDYAGVIKRETDRDLDAVRIMTVHGAKGLEANIVFLLDAYKPPNLKGIGFPLSLQNKGALPVLAGAKTRDIHETKIAREIAEQRAYEEYRRLFYVAATRARDILIIGGVESGNDKTPHEKAAVRKSWHSLSLDALQDLGATAIGDEAPFWEDSDTIAMRWSTPQTTPVEPDTPLASPVVVESPTWLFENIAPEKPPLRLSPSRLADEDERASQHAPSEDAPFSPLSGDQYFRGRILHRLFELLPETAPDMREDAADRLLSHLAGDVPVEERRRWRNEVIKVIDEPLFAPVFSPGSKAEAAIAGTPDNARKDIFISGQIDRLVVTPERVLAVDYKTNRPPPHHVEDAASSYLAQMAAYRALLQEIYPGRRVESALLWTFEARLMPLPDTVLDHAFARWLKAG